MKRLYNFSEMSWRELAAQPLFLAICLAAVAGTWAGWQLFWFLTDDAFIAFRYISNDMLGYGLVWNPPPFRPVEGYTSLLWILLLEGIWRVAGWMPPESANIVSLLFGYGALVLSVLFLKRMHVPVAMARYRLALLVWVLVGVLSNRTFLAWLSSGLETACFNFFLIWWVYCGFAAMDKRGARWVLGLSLSVTCTTLTRPDGLLFLMVSLLLLLLHVVRFEERTHVRWRELLQAIPLLAIPLHLLWRYAQYGEWLPNTYYAKYVSPWPESGIRYLASFVVEYGLWVWGIFALWWLWRAARDRNARWVELAYRYHHALLVLGAILAHIAYYTLKIGGDHFEYRIFSYLIPLFFLSAVWFLVRLTRSSWALHTGMALFWLLSLPIPWLHWQETHEINTREPYLIKPIAQRFPQPLQPLIAYWDGWQAWLISHSVGMRHQEHKIFWQEQVGFWPERGLGSQVAWSERAVAIIQSVGVPSWNMPEVAIIDLKGLNDWVTARSPQVLEVRQMAHDRMPPLEYVLCFRPNVFIDKTNGKIIVKGRTPLLSDEEIRACESRDWLAIELEKKSALSTAD
ncbi:MAG: arabinofuranosyltransferase [Candidatus Latescibacterota bacterium]